MTALPEFRAGLPRVVRCASIIGDSTIDLRPLSGESGVVLVKIAAAAGDTHIIVPRGTPVNVRLIGVIGEQNKKRRGEGLMRRLGRRLGVVEEQERPVRAPGPTVVVTGFKLIGDTVIEEE